MPGDAQLFAAFSDTCRAMALRLEPLLTRDGAEFYTVKVDRQVRIGWTLNSSHRLLATLQSQRNGLRFSLRAGRDSRFLGAQGMLKQDRTRPDDGTVLLQGDDIPDWLTGAIDDAFRLAAERRAAQEARSSRRRTR